MAGGVCANLEKIHLTAEIIVAAASLKSYNDKRSLFKQSEKGTV
jgi:hypothetical protein